MTQKKESMIAFSNRVFNLHVSEDIAAKRDEFCPSKNQFHCSQGCPIYQTYYVKGLSCNQALDRYPDECKRLMETSPLLKKGVDIR